MRTMASWLHCPFMLVIAAILLGIMPVIPEPHLLQKLHMLFNGDLVKPVDIFDLLCHWINTRGWHATAAGGMLIAMTIGLEVMRIAAEEQKWEREQYDAEFDQ